jgi:hypothetical protein
LANFYAYYGDDFKIECPTGSGKMMTLYEVLIELSQRLSRIFLKDDSGRRAVYGGTETFQNDAHWRDHILFYEYFHADTGAGIGASHQTGWTGIIATIMTLMHTVDAASVSQDGLKAFTSTIAATSKGKLHQHIDKPDA